MPESRTAPAPMSETDIVAYLEERLALMTEHLGGEGYLRVVLGLIERLQATDAFGRYARGEHGHGT